MTMFSARLCAEAMKRLERIIQNRQWSCNRYPFRYVYATNVFKPDFYANLEADYIRFLSKGLAETSTGGQFSRSMSGYDAYGMSLPKLYTGPLGFLLWPEWHHVMCNLFGVKGTGYVNAGLHHHQPNSDNGFIHNDFNPVWFPRAGDGPIRQSGGCSYKTGAGLPPDEKIEVVRGVVMIFYLCNSYEPGDGGETGFFKSGHDPISKAVVAVPPLNNSIVLYECTPYSFHSFLANHKPRNSVIMWIHRTMEDVLEQWDESQLERWVDEP